jgi:hypothetical protein
VIASRVYSRPRLSWVMMMMMMMMMMTRMMQSEIDSPCGEKNAEIHLQKGDQS